MRPGRRPPIALQLSLLIIAVLLEIAANFFANAESAPLTTGIRQARLSRRIRHPVCHRPARREAGRRPARQVKRTSAARTDADETDGGLFGLPGVDGRQDGLPQPPSEPTAADGLRPSWDRSAPPEAP